MSADAQHVLYGTILLVLIPVAYLLMRRGWRRRGRRDQGLGPVPGQGAAVPEPAAAPEPPGADEGLAEAVYVSTTVAGAPFERVVAHGLGSRSGAGVGVVGVTGDGSDGPACSPTGAAVVVRRDGARSLLVPAADVVGVRRQRGQVGKFVAGRGGGLVVITWRLGRGEVDTALHLRDPRDAEDLVASVAALVRPAGGAGDGTGAVTS